jgi:ribonuclease Z
MLQRGEAVTLDSGQTIDPGQVVGQARAGRRIVFSGDTRPCPATIEAAAAADALIHEATFLDEDAERARQTGHTTAGQAARMARDAQVSLLAITHLSTRYLVRDVRREAEAELPNTVVPRDFDVLDLPLPERGPPELQRGGAVPVPPAEVPVAE